MKLHRFENFYKIKNINEGLIKSINYEKFYDFLLKLFKKYDIEITKSFNNHNGIFVEFDIDLMDKNFIEELDNLLNISGYNINYSYLDDILIKRKPTTKEFFKHEKIAISFVKKFDKNDDTIPEFLYHITEKIYLDKILKKGLIPKSNQKIEHHPDRIYLLSSMDGVEEFLEILEDNYPEKKFITLKINTKILNNFKLYFDPTFFSFEEDFKNSKYKAYYTYDNITPNAIEIIK